MPSYDYTEIRDAAIDSTLYSDISSYVTLRTIINDAVRFVFGDVDLRTAKRKAAASPNLFNDVYDYTCPTDLKGISLIDVVPQINRSKDSDIELTTPEQFDRRKTLDRMMVAFSEDSFTRKLRISMDIDDDQLLVSELDSLTSGGGTWVLFGDGTNLTQDLDNFVKGGGSINWDISAAGGTTAGIQNTDLDDFDLTDYLSAGSIFVWVYITDKTDVTNFIIRIGSSTSNYYTRTITTTNEGTAFVDGWNLLRFDLASITETGTVDDDACNYVALYMTKDAGKISETDYRFDWLVVKRGKIYEIHYYTKYGWQTSAGVYIENSTADTDLVNADIDELELIKLKVREFLAEASKDYKEADYHRGKYIQKKGEYVIKYPSESKLLTTDYYSF